MDVPLLDDDLCFPETVEDLAIEAFIPELAVASVSPAIAFLSSKLDEGIGHIKKEHRMERNYLAGTQGVAINAILAAAGYNFRLLLTWLRFLLRLTLVMLFGTLKPRHA